MIIRIYKNIHNKYPKFFKFFFFLRYLFAIFLIATTTFFLAPKLFNYEKKIDIIKDYLVNYYDLRLENYSDIKFNIFPSPNLSIGNVNLKIKDKPIFLETKDLKIFLNFKNIYDYKNFKAKKISFSQNEITLDMNSIKELLNYFRKLKYNLDIKELDLILKKEEDSILEIKKINFSNYGYKKYKINGEIFNKKFKANLKNNNKNLDFRILNTGIKANFKLNEKNLKNTASGSSKISILDNYFKLNFNLNNNQVEIINSSFRNKNLSIFFNSLIQFNPFFEISSDINIEEIDKQLINNISLEKILKNKKVIKKLNSNNRVNYKAKKFGNKLIENLTFESNLAYGRLNFLNEIIVAGGVINCKGDSVLIEEYPRLNFDCIFKIKDKKKIFRKFSISKKFDKNPINLNIKGSFNIFNKKINFKKINIGTSYIAKKEDMKFFKETFESILFDEDFFNIFKISKIKNFLLEVI